MGMKARYYYLQAHAHKMVTLAVVHGDLIPPDCCSKCGKPDILDAHHTDYSKPLEVIWLCRSCHLGVHGKKDTIYPKVYNAAKIVEDYIADNLKALEMKGTDLARLLGVGKSTVYNVLAKYKNQGTRE